MPKRSRRSRGEAAEQPAAKRRAATAAAAAGGSPAGGAEREEREEREAEDASGAVGDDCLAEVLGWLGDSRSLARCSQVSRRWRRVARSPALWARTVVVLASREAMAAYATSPYARMPCRLHIAAHGQVCSSIALAARCGENLLGLRLRGCGERSGDLDMLGALCTRLDTFECVDPYDEGSRAVANLVRLCPTLTTLDAPAYSGVARALAVPSVCPRLQRLRIGRPSSRDVELWATALALRGPLLRSLSITVDRRSELGEVTRALAACPGLRELVVKNAVPPPDFTAAVAERCKSLSTLRLLFPSGDRYLGFRLLHDLLRGLSPLAETLEVLEVVCRSSWAATESEEDIAAALRALPRLRVLHLPPLDLSGHAVLDALASLERLEVLDLHRWSWGARAQRSVCELLRRCTRVRDLDLSEVRRALAPVLRSIGEHQRCLRRLSFGRSYGEPLNATDASVRALVPALAGVEDLRLGSSRVSEDLLVELLRGAPALTSLTAACVVTRRTLELLADDLTLAPRLRWARVALDAPNVEAMARLRERRKGLVVKDAGLWMIEIPLDFDNGWADTAARARDTGESSDEESDEYGSDSDSEYSSYSSSDYGYDSSSDSAFSDPSHSDSSSTTSDDDDDDDDDDGDGDEHSAC
eukprot:m51a1_g14508 hypothetical protein (644) ;mRNA; r:820955-823398